MSNSPFNKRIVATNVQGVPVSTGGGVETCFVDLKRPMPCIVILVHGVNDVGEAYQNQEEGIIKGLNKRLGRDDLYQHEWHQYKMDMGDGEQQQIKKAGRSPVIPFYWGYKPVDHATYIEDQRRYRAEVDKLGDGAKLPYDAYQEDDKAKLEKLGHIKTTTLKYTNDNFGNALDDVYAKNGGTFANATTNIPDMLGPGSTGLATDLANFYSLYGNGGDYTHPIYNNPHRIYQFFAAQRLADLILTIRKTDPLKDDAINIVAHSQGTIITMLANMLVKQAGQRPADCVILNHSPYALENTNGETITSGHHQTNRARQETFKNFCNLMKTNPRFNDGCHTDAEIEELEGAVCIGGKSQWKNDKLYRRNNFGKVYNYFCPNDTIVSLLNVQGFGWRGIPHEIAKDLVNLKQRVFCENGPNIGNSPLTTPFEMPEPKKGFFVQDSLQTKQYTFSDVVINGEQLPEPFTHVLQGVDNVGNKYYSDIEKGSPDEFISYSAKANALKRTEIDTRSLRWCGFGQLPAGYVLSESELKVFSREYKRNYISGFVLGKNNSDSVQLVHEKTPEELEKEWMQSDPVGYSQHSSIVASIDAPAKAMAFDLAIGRCKAFEYKEGQFWIDLLCRADWRIERNGFDDARAYYQTGKLNVKKTKELMNFPGNALPKGDFGVVNEYYNSTKVKPAQRNETHNEEVAHLQWAMPEPKHI
ncbi:DUF3274 domain-containing protein [Atlantibacter sp.]|uniref:T6SS effector phospholipase Tle3 domain-containing protein n=1 Tax=Atlantibacter sp. TaxID=1903473 RepID=UPI0028A709D0|nr:DUF3274 domain-containing protein [Atlantibacter sp.]